MLSEALQRNASMRPRLSNISDYSVDSSEEALRFFASFRMTRNVLLVVPSIAVSLLSFHCGNERTGLVPVGALLVGVGDLQKARFIERFAQELQSDWQPMSIHFG